MSGCASRTPIQYETQYAQIPATFQQVPAIPPIPKRGDISVGEGVILANRLRIAVCTYHSRYRELLRYATQGKTVLADAGKQECPK